MCIYAKTRSVILWNFSNMNIIAPIVFDNVFYLEDLQVQKTSYDSIAPKYALSYLLKLIVT